MSFKPITITQLNTYIKQVFDAEELLHGIGVVGEISGWSNIRGTAYFTLKDEASTLSCVCFTADNFQDFKTGDSVMAIGSVKFYSKSGKMNFNVVKLEHYGANILYQKFLELKTSLESLGFFSEEHKVAIPKQIKRIGVVSSEGGAVIQDIINVRTRRNPGIDIVLYPVKVQGIDAEYEIAKGIEFFDGYDVDVIVVARGGGSFEDLAPFNTEIVARATYNCNKPIVSAVGHETDYTIIDFCSDLRAPTPSAAAELLCRDLEVDKRNLEKYKQSLIKTTDYFLENKKKAILKLSNDIDKQYNYIYSNYSEKLRNKVSLLNKGMEHYFSGKEKSFENKKMLLNKLNPESVLKLGYACVKSGEYITSVKNIEVGKNIDIYLKDGEFSATVNSVKEKK